MSLSSDIDSSFDANSELNVDSSTNSSEGTEKSKWGVVYADGRAQLIENIELGVSTNWSKEDESRYLARVQEKGKALASSIISNALAEAEVIRQKAYEEGLSKGLSDAEDELEAFRESMGESVSAVLSTIEGQCSHIFSEWKLDLLQVAKESVEKITEVVLSEDRRTMLENLLVNSVELLDNNKTLLVRVNPEDAPVIEDIIAMAKLKMVDGANWKVQGDPGINPGGMSVENDYSFTETSIESRKQAVNMIFDSLMADEENQK